VPRSDGSIGPDYGLDADLGEQADPGKTELGKGGDFMQIRIAFLAGLAAIAAAVPSARADGDAQAGEALFKKNCTICHTTEEGKNKIGPSLHAVVGRHSAALTDFAYSDAMKKADKTWDDQTLDTYLTNPRALVPGTKMIFIGFKNEQDRQNVIAYLNTRK
jgi:cytochrome c